MADHPVPQDVEADDKLIGPFGFRQFVYLMIVGGLIVLAIALWQVFPLLSIIPVPFAIFLLIMALPLKKDQPMETYLAALFHFYLHSHNRWWAPGQRETTILITAPKKEEEPFSSVSQEEASNRLSFLANVIDTEGEAVNHNMNSAFLADAADTQDMFDADSRSGNLSSLLAKEDLERRNTINQIMSGNPPAAYNNNPPAPYGAPGNPAAPYGAPGTAYTAPSPAAPYAAPGYVVSQPNPYAAPNPGGYPATPGQPNPMADGILTPAEILTGGRAISSGDLPAAPTPPMPAPPAPAQFSPNNQNPDIINNSKVNPTPPNSNNPYHGGY